MKLKMKMRRRRDLLIEPLLNNGQPVTLFVNGVVISGMTAKASDFYRRIYPVTGDSYDDPTVFDDFARFIEEEEAAMDRARETPAEERTDDQRSLIASPWSFIHLVDARYQVGGGGLAPQNAGLNLRIRLDAIDAWTVGQMEYLPAQ